MKPLIRYVGGKGRLATQILDRITADFQDPMNYAHYMEPFVGGGAIFAALYDEGHLDNTEVTLSDSNPHLMGMYRDLQDADSVEHVNSSLRVMEKSYALDGEACYLKHRDFWNDGKQSTARFIFLHQTGYNGLWRVNPQGKLNVAWGKLKRPNFPKEEQLMEWHEALQGATILCQSFEHMDVEKPGGALVYLDPPYYGTFTGYTESGFSFLQHVQLLCQAHVLRTKGATVFYSNKYTEELRDLIKVVTESDFYSWPLELKRTIAQTGSEEADEVLYGFEREA